MRIMRAKCSKRAPPRRQPALPIGAAYVGTARLHAVGRDAGEWVYNMFDYNRRLWPDRVVIKRK